MTPQKNDEPAVMQELHELRERLHEEWKDLTPRQLSERLHRETSDTIRKLGLRVENDDLPNARQRIG
jgi:hypothetical protein